MYVSTLLIYVQDERPQTQDGNPKIRPDNQLGSRRVEDTKGVNLNTILIKLKCQNTLCRAFAPITVMSHHALLTSNGAGVRQIHESFM